MRAQLGIEPGHEPVGAALLTQRGVEKQVPVGRLGIAIHIGHRLAEPREGDGQIGGDGGLAGTALSAGDGEFHVRACGVIYSERASCWEAFPPCPKPARP